MTSEFPESTMEEVYLIIIMHIINLLKNICSWLSTTLNKIGKIYKLHTDSERPNIQDNKQDPV